MSKQGLQDIKRKHQYLILKELFLQETATMANLIDKTNLSQPSVRNMVRFLQEKNLIKEKGNEQSTGGRCPTCFSLVKEHYRILCFYIQNHKMYYQIREYDEIEEIGEFEQNIESIAQLITKRNIHCCVFAVEGIVQEQQYITDHKNQFKTHIWIRELSQKVKIPIYVENDVKAMHLGHSYKNKRSDSVYIHINERGVGTSYIGSEYPLKGLNGLVGEIGLIPYKNTSLNQQIRSCSHQEEFNEIMAYLVMMVITMIDPKSIYISLDIPWFYEKEEVFKYIQNSFPFNMQSQIEYQEKFDILVFDGLGCFAIESLMKKRIGELT